MAEGEFDDLDMKYLDKKYYNDKGAYYDNMDLDELDEQYNLLKQENLDLLEVPELYKYIYIKKI